MALFRQRDKNKAQEYLKEYKNIQHLKRKISILGDAQKVSNQKITRHTKKLENTAQNKEENKLIETEPEIIHDRIFGQGYSTSY